MADFEVPEGTQWSERFIFGLPADRWRLDDWHVQADFVLRGTDTPVRTLSTLTGGLLIADPVARHLVASLSKVQVAALTVGTAYDFDFLFINKANGLTDRSGRYALTVTGGITRESA